MVKITLNGKKMKSKKAAHKYIKWKLDLPDYYGENLDALWDVLSTYSEPTEINIINKEDLIENLDGHGEGIISVFQDACEENDKIRCV